MGRPNQCKERIISAALTDQVALTIVLASRPIDYEYVVTCPGYVACEVANSKLLQ